MPCNNNQNKNVTQNLDLIFNKKYPSKGQTIRDFVIVSLIQRKICHYVLFLTSLNTQEFQRIELWYIVIHVLKILLLEILAPEMPYSWRIKHRCLNNNLSFYRQHFKR